MKRSVLFVRIGLLAATTASAQNPPARSGPNDSAVNSPDKTTPMLLLQAVTASPKATPNPGLLTALLALEAGNVIDMRLRRIAQAAPRQQPKAS